MNVFIIISLIIYVLSVILSYKSIQKMHSKGGELECVGTDPFNFIIIFIPISNTFVALHLFDMNKFFKIRK